MTSPGSPIAYRRLRAPSENRAMLIEPAGAALDELIAKNAELRDGWLGSSAASPQNATDCGLAALDPNHPSHQNASREGPTYDFQGRTLDKLSAEARRQLLIDARHWTREYCDVDLPTGDDSQTGESTTPIFLAGHQPQLFHPGVWLKNFFLDGLARRRRAVAVNLIIDNDAVKQTSLRVPCGSIERPRLETTPFDRPTPGVPYELCRIADREAFDSFGRRATEQIAPLVGDPLLTSYWPAAVRQAAAGHPIGACLARSRHALEVQWGLRTLELPQSRVCDLRPFYWFTAHLLAQLPRFHAAHNKAVRDYRRVHRIRSRAHPFPELEADGEWLEAPFWVYSDAAPQRRRLFVRRRNRSIVLGDRDAAEFDLPLHAVADAHRTVERLGELRRRGVRIRSRALTTTLFARLLLGDLFVHGIGGAKYDQVTDALIERFFGLAPPGFATVSGTLHLPISGRPRETEPPGELRQQLWRLTHHPEQFFNGAGHETAELAGELDALIAEKQRWIETPQTPQNAQVRCRAIRQINAALQPWVRPQREGLDRRLQTAFSARQADAVLRSREYGFCLYPVATLRRFFARVLPKIA